MSFTSIKEIIKEKLEHTDFTQGVIASEIRETSEKVIEESFPNLFNQIQVLKFKKGKLIIKVANPGLAQELKLNEQKLIKKINNKVEQGEIKKIIFKSR